MGAGVGLVLVGSLFAACSDTGEPSGTCLTGSRVCNGNIVYLCDPPTATFVEERVCPEDTQCVSGACVPNDFADGGVDAQPDRAPEPEPEPEPEPSSDVADTEGVDDLVGPSPDTDVAVDIELSETVPDAFVDLPAEPEPEPEPEPDVPDIPDVVEIVEDMGPDLPPGPEDPFDPGLLLYQKVDHFVQGNLDKVKWHSSGDFALILGTSGQVLRYDVGTGAVEVEATLGTAVADLDVSQDGAFFLVMGTADGQATLWRGTPGAEGVGFEEELKMPFGEAGVVVAEPGGTEFALGTSTDNDISYLFLWEDGEGITATKAFNGGVLYDLMWSNPALHMGSRAIITSEGWGWVGSHTWLLTPNDLIDNGYKAGFGNPGGAGFRPDGSYGILAGWTSNVLYVFDGGWQSTYLPGVNNGASPQTVAWRHNGTRALIVGRVTGSSPAATVFDHAPGFTSGYNSALYTNVSIPGFDGFPWFGDFNVYLSDADWRPVACDEGLIVGTDTSNAPYGLVIRYWDQDDPACTP